MNEPTPAKPKPGEKCVWAGVICKIEFFYASGLSPWAPKDMAKITFELNGMSDCVPISELQPYRDTRKNNR